MRTLLLILALSLSSCVYYPPHYVVYTAERNEQPYEKKKKRTITTIRKVNGQVVYKHKEDL